MAGGAASPSQAADWTDANDPTVTYTALRSLKGANSGYVATDITPLCTDIVKMKFQPVAVAGALFCARDASASGMFTCYHSTADGSMRIDRGAKSDSNQKTSTSKVSTGNDYLLTADYGNKTATIVLSGGGADLFGKALGGADTYTVGSSLALFAMHSNHKSYSYYGTDYIYYFELYDSSGDLTHCLLPAQRNTDSVYGFYDTKAGKFYPQSGGAFTVAARTVNVTDTCKKWIGRGDGVSMSDGENWEGGLAPGYGDNLDFTLAPPLAEINADISGVTFGKLWLDDGDIPTFTGSMTVSDCNDRTKVAGNTSVVFTAGDYTWRSTETNWGDADAWTFDNAAATWADNNNAIFSTADAEATLAADVTANSLVFNANATISGSSTLTVPSVSVASGVAATISAPTAGTLEKTGAGALTLGSSRTDQTTLSEGTLKIASGATVDGTKLTLGTDAAKPVVFDYGGQTLTANPAQYLGAGMNVTLTNGVFTYGSAIGFDGMAMPSVLTIPAGATLTSDWYSLNTFAASTINVVGGTLKSTANGNSWFMQASPTGRMYINVTDGGLLEFGGETYMLTCRDGDNNYQSPELHLKVVDSTFTIKNNKSLRLGCDGNTKTSATPVFSLAATNSVFNIPYAIFFGNDKAGLPAGGAYTAVFDNCTIKTPRFYAYADRTLNKATFDGSTFEFSADGQIYAARDGDIDIAPGGLTFDTNGKNVALEANLGGTGALKKTGSGKLTIAKSQTSTGALSCEAGETFVSGGLTVNRPVTVKDGATLTVQATAQSSFASLAFESGSTLNIDSYAVGVTAIAATALALPDSGTVALKFNGGAFPTGRYAILEKAGITVADVEGRLVPSVSAGAPSWEASGGILYLVVKGANDCIWTGSGGDARLGNAANWLGGNIPASGANVFIALAAAGEIECDIADFSPASITFPSGSAQVTIDGAGSITGIRAITNLAAAHHVFNCEVVCADGITPDITRGRSNYMTFAGGITMYNAPKTGGAVTDCWSGKITITTTDAQDYNSDNKNYIWLVPSTGTTFTFENGCIDHMRLDPGATAVVNRLTYNGCSRSEGNNKAWFSLVFDNGNGVLRAGEIKSTSDAVLFHSYADSDMVGGTIIADKLTCATTKQTGGSFPYPVFMLNCGAVANGDVVKDGWNGEGVWVIGPGGLAFGETIHTRSHFETKIGKSLGGRPAATLHSFADWALQSSPNGRNAVALQIGSGNSGFLVIDTSHYAIGDAQYDSATSHTVTLDGMVTGGPLRVEGNGKVVFANEYSDFAGGLTVTNTATASVKAGCKPGSGTVTLATGTTLEVAESGTVALGGGLALKNGAVLAFNYTGRDEPVLDLTGKTVTFDEGETTNVTVRISADAGVRAHGGANVLTAGGKFADTKVTLAEGAPDWVSGVAVENGEIVLSVKSVGLTFTVW